MTEVSQGTLLTVATEIISTVLIELNFVDSDHLEPNGFYPFDYNLNYSLPSDVVVSDKYMSFEVSGKETDFGQNTIPYIDIQDLTTKVPYPMSGVGLYYRESQSNMYAGFLGLKLKTYNFSRILTKRS